MFHKMKALQSCEKLQISLMTYLSVIVSPASLTFLEILFTYYFHFFFLRIMLGFINDYDDNDGL